MSTALTIKSGDEMNIGNTTYIKACKEECSACGKDYIQSYWYAGYPLEVEKGLRNGARIYQVVKKN